MNTLIFSDTHLGPVFEEKKFNFLKNKIIEADQVIINGDFWEGYLFSFDQFLTSPWSLLFPYLKDKNTVYIYGNHDKKIQSSEKTNLFSSIQTSQYTQRLNGHKLIIEHGNNYVHGEKNNNQVLTLRKEFIQRIMDRVERLIMRNGGKKMMHSLVGHMNAVIKRKIVDGIGKDEILVCGHTHVAEFDLPRKFINSGIVRHGLAQYLEIVGTSITPKEEWYD